MVKTPRKGFVAITVIFGGGSYVDATAAENTAIYGPLFRPRVTSPG